MTEEDRQRRARHRKPTGAEWVIFAISLAVIAAVAAVLVADWAGSGKRPPSFDARPIGMDRIGDAHHVEVEVKNTGDESAADVRVDAKLTIDGEETEADETIDFLAPGEDSTVTFVFTDDPDEGTLELHVTSFREP